MSAEAGVFLVPPCQQSVRTLYRDDWIWVVDKPAGLLSVPGRDPRNKDSVFTRLSTQQDDLRVVHRLDLGTSGVMVFACHVEAQRALGRQFEQRLVEKRYEALVDGWVAADYGTIDWPLMSDWSRRPRQKACLVEGKAALTFWQLLQRDQECGVSRLRLFPRTGRSHQLRVHLALLGHPILGCHFYGNGRSQGASSRLCLHATELQFKHPGDGRDCRFFSERPF